MAETPTTRQAVVALVSQSIHGRPRLRLHALLPQCSSTRSLHAQQQLQTLQRARQALQLEQSHSHRAGPAHWQAQAHLQHAQSMLLRQPREL